MQRVNRRANRNQSIIIAVLSILLVGMLSITITLAFFTDRDSRTSELTFGNISLNSIGEGSPVSIINKDESTREVLMPGDTLETSFTVELASSSEAAWIRFRFGASVDYPAEITSLITHESTYLDNSKTFIITTAIDTVSSILWTKTISNSVVDFARVANIVTSDSESNETDYTVIYNDIAPNIAVTQFTYNDGESQTVVSGSDLETDLLALVNRLNKMALCINAINQSILDEDNFTDGSTNLIANYFASGTDGYIYRYYAMGRDGEATSSPALANLGDEYDPNYPETVTSIPNVIYDYQIPRAIDNSLQGVTITYTLSVEAVQYANNNRAIAGFSSQSTTRPVPIVTGDNATEIVEAIRAFYVVEDANPTQISAYIDPQFPTV